MHVAGTFGYTSDNATTIKGDHALIPLIIHGDRCAATRIDIPCTCARPQLELGYVIGNQEVKLTGFEIFAADVPAGMYISKCADM